MFMPSSALFSDKAFSLSTAAGVVGLRPVVPEDREFLLQVYSGSRSEEMNLVDWDDRQKNEFLRMQFEAQDKYYREYYPSASFGVLLLENSPCGRLYIDRWASEIRIVDIAILPEFRNRGIGTALLSHIIDEAEKLHLPVSIHVEQFNPALSLYQRLGFLPIGENGIYHLMNRAPSQPTPVEEQLTVSQNG